MKYNFEALFNISEMEKGNVILQEQIELLCGVNRKDDVELYRFHQMRAAQQLANALAGRGKVYTVVCRKCNIHVLTDSDASKYNQRAFDNGVKKSRRSTARLLSVDVSNLSPAEVVEHDRATNRQARALAALKAGMRGLPINVPGIKSDRVNPLGEGRAKPSSEDMDRYRSVGKRKKKKDKE